MRSYKRTGPRQTGRSPSGTPGGGLLAASVVAQAHMCTNTARSFCLLRASHAVDEPDSMELEDGDAAGKKGNPAAVRAIDINSEICTCALRQCTFRSQYWYKGRPKKLPTICSPYFRTGLRSERLFTCCTILLLSWAVMTTNRPVATAASCNSINGSACILHIPAACEARESGECMENAASFCFIASAYGQPPSVFRPFPS